MRIRAGLAAGIAAACLLATCGIGAAEPWPGLEVTGTPSHWGQTTGWNATTIERVRLLRDLALLFHSTAAVGGHAEIDGLVACARDFDLVERRTSALATPVSGWRQFRGGPRRAFTDLLDAIGYEMVDGKRASLRPVGGPKAEALRGLLKTAGFSVDAFIRDLDEERPAHLARPSFTVPLPLGREYWSTRIVGEPLTDTGLAVQILQNRRLALLYVGLFSLDAESLAALATHPTFVPRMPVERTGVFAAFGRSLHVRGRRIVTPGGEALVPFWQDVVGAPVDDPVRFTERLLSADGGRLAWFFDFVQRAEPKVQAFALASWETAAGERRRRVRALYDAMWDSVEVEHFTFTERPFVRPTFNPTLVLSLVATDDKGLPSSPSSIRFWQRVFESQDLPAVLAVPYRPASRDDVLDAAGLVRLIADVTRVDAHRESEQRASALLLAQSYAIREPAAPPAAIASIARAALRFPALVRALERMQVSAAMTVRAVERAALLSRLSPDRFLLAAGQFQAALALVEQAWLVSSLSREEVEGLTGALLDVRLDPERRFTGGVLHWMATALLPLAARYADVPDCTAHCSSDPQLVALLTGRVKGRDAPSFEWDGWKYQVDLPTVRYKEALRARAAAPTLTVDAAVDLLAVAESVGHVDGPAAARAAAAQLRAAAAALPSAPGDAPLCDQLLPSSELVSAARLLDQVRAAKKLDGRDRAAALALRTLDCVGLETLRALVYLPHAAGPRGGVSGAADLARRHDFGSALGNEHARDLVAWAMPKARAGLGVQWHVEGAFVGFDQAGASLAMLEPLDGPPTPGQFDVYDRTVLVQSATAVSLDHPPDASFLAALGAQMAQARERLASGVPPPDPRAEWSPVAREWAMAHEPDALPTLFRLNDLLTLGGPNTPDLTSIGTQFDRVTGTLRSIAPPRIIEDIVPGYVGRGYYAAGTLDLKIRVAELMTRGGVPAVLFRTLSARATSRVLTDASPGAAFDWTTLRRRMADFSADAFAAAIAGLASDGTLVLVP